MVNLLGYALAGAAEGAGKGLVEQAKSAKEARRDEIKFAREQAARKDQNAFTAGENQSNRDQQTSERKDSQIFTAGQNAANNSAAAGRQTAASRLAIELETLRNDNSTAATDAANARQDVIRGEDKLTAAELRAEGRFYEGLSLEKKQAYDLMSDDKKRAFITSEREAAQVSTKDRDATAAEVAAAAAKVGSGRAADAATTAAERAATAATALADTRASEGLLSSEATAALNAENNAAAADRQGLGIDAARATQDVDITARALAAKAATQAAAEAARLTRDAGAADTDKRLTAAATAQTERLAASMDELNVKLASGGTPTVMPNGNLGTARGDVVTPLLMPDGTPIKAPPVQNNARYTAVFTTMMKSFVDSGMPVTDDQLVSALMAAQSAADGTMPAPAAGADPEAPAQVLGDAVPKGKVKPEAYPDAVWSNRVGGWVVKRNDAWLQVKE
jgi:hypothetical protein